MARKCYISFKTEDNAYKVLLQDLKIDMIDKSLNQAINSYDEDYIMRKIREDYLSDSTVTIHLIGAFGAENRGEYEQRFIKRELQASLYDSTYNTKNGILGIVLPIMYQLVYKGAYPCQHCGQNHEYIVIDNNTTIKEFSYNYYIPNNKCAWWNEDHYCVLVKWDDFVRDPERYIEDAYNKRTQSIAAKTKVRP